LGGIFVTALSNLTLIGQDWIMFLSHDIGHRLHFTDDFSSSTSPLYHYLLVPQAWSVALELTFYALVPFLNGWSSRWLTFVAVASMALRVLAYRWLGAAHDPWTYRFFPFEISLFIFGMLGFRLFDRTRAYHPSRRFRCASKPSYLAAGALLLLLLYVHLQTVAYITRVVGREIGILLTYPFWIVAIPVLFLVFGGNKTDRIVGELSYPVYLIHFVVIGFVTVFLGRFGLERGSGVISALVSLLLSGILYSRFITPLDQRRHRLTKPEKVDANTPLPHSLNAIP
jgi:peptidoglycan/LPS O-acetylase OafA/YrhL